MRWNFAASISGAQILFAHASLESGSHRYEVVMAVMSVCILLSTLVSLCTYFNLLSRKTVIASFTCKARYKIKCDIFEVDVGRSCKCI